MKAQKNCRHLCILDEQDSKFVTIKFHVTFFTICCMALTNWRVASLIADILPLNLTLALAKTTEYDEDNCYEECYVTLFLFHLNNDEFAEYIFRTKQPFEQCIEEEIQNPRIERIKIFSFVEFYEIMCNQLKTNNDNLQIYRQYFSISPHHNSYYFKNEHIHPNERINECATLFKQYCMRIIVELKKYLCENDKINNAVLSIEYQMSEEMIHMQGYVIKNVVLGEDEDEYEHRDDALTTFASKNEKYYFK